MSNHPIAQILPLKDSKVVKENPTFGFTIHHCVPTQGGFHLLITDGLRKTNQAVNEENVGLERIELYISLPDYWDLENISWPIEWLNRLAEIPQKNQTWFGMGDTIPAGNPPEELDAKLKANHFMLSKPIKHESLLSVPESKEMSFQMLAVIPIFQNELDFKLKNSHTMLLNKLAKKGVTEHFDLFRQTTCKRRFFGLFG